MPNWVFDTSEPADFALYAEALPKLAGVGAQIPVSWAHETLKIPMPQEGEPVLGQPAAPTPAPTANLAALRAQAPSVDPIESLSASLAGDWREVITPWTDPIEAALTESIANGETAEQFLSRLPPLLQQMDVSSLTERLARAAFAVRLMGEAGIDI
jgi:phage gp29-like protein